MRGPPTIARRPGHAIPDRRGQSPRRDQPGGLSGDPWVKVRDAAVSPARDSARQVGTQKTATGNQTTDSDPITKPMPRHRPPPRSARRSTIHASTSADTACRRNSLRRPAHLAAMANQRPLQSTQRPAPPPGRNQEFRVLSGTSADSIRSTRRVISNCRCSRTSECGSPRSIRGRPTAV